MRNWLRSSFIGVAVWAAGALLPSSALACGGFFCNAAQPVNQAAEGIIFADNGDGTTTAVIQIQYQGPSTNFSWLLPISSVPQTDADIGIASNIALQRLQSATNPSYSLTVKVEGTCQQPSDSAGCGSSSASASSAGTSREVSVDASVPHGVTVDASGVVGAFMWTVISLDTTLADPADIAVAWLKANGYDVPSSAPALLGPYLQQGLHLLALRLTKGADAGSIRPIVLTYAGTQPSIPVRLTAVAANDDMGVLTWVLGKSRAVPANYLSLELNEARINWFNAASNYNAVVTEAANDAGGQGFVTELAGPTSALARQIWTASDEESRSILFNMTNSTPSALFAASYQLYGQWDGFWDAARGTVTEPNGLTLADLKACPTCYTVQLEPAAYLAELDKQVIEPVKLVQRLVDAHPEITRLYTTLSADEMTLDPLFAFNPGAPDLSSVHTADRVIECNPGVDQFGAPWRIELPQGGVVWGGPADIGSWPTALSALPSNRVITRTSESGTGQVLEDNSDAIAAQLSTYNSGKSSEPSSGGCAAGRNGRPSSALLALAVLGAAVVRRRRRLDRPLPPPPTQC